MVTTNWTAELQKLEAQKEKSNKANACIERFLQEEKKRIEIFTLQMSFMSEKEKTDVEGGSKNKYSNFLPGEEKKD